MNWFTRTYIAAQSLARKQEMLDEDSGCPHVEQDLNLATVMRRENDSCGTVGSFVSCDACDRKIQEEEDDETHICRDCELPKKKRDGGFWRWYDFYAAQGDEALFICHACRQLPKHVERVRQDKADEEAEFGNRDGYTPSL